MGFLWPVLLLLLLLIPLAAVAYVWYLRRRRPAAVRYSSLSLIRSALPRASRFRRHLPFALLLAASAALLMGFSRPYVVASLPASEATIVLAIDVSGSMCSSDISPSRLEAAEQAAAQFIHSQGPGTQIGIVAFSGFAQVVQAPTNNQTLLLEALQSLVTGRRTAIGSGLLASIDAIAETDPSVEPSTGEGRPGVEPAAPAAGDYAPDIVVLLTDGANNAGIDPLAAATQAANRGLRVYTIGFGTSNPQPLESQCAQQIIGREPGGGGGFGNGFGFGNQPQGAFNRGIDEVTLRAVANATGGQYYPAESSGELQQVFSNLPTSLITRHEVQDVAFAFLAVGGALAAAALLLARAWRPLP
jgi:Ca-activated chloride channel family protein